MDSLDILSEVLAEKEEESQRAIPTAWRWVLRSIANALAKKDYCLATAVPGVELASPDVAAHIQGSICGYGETLVELSDETWKSSICMWYGTHWEVLVDLWTLEAGRSDLVLSVSVTEAASGIRFKVHMVYVP